MSQNRKVSIVVLGTGDHLKKNLISVILWRDVFAQRITSVKTETYHNDKYEVTYTPNFYTESDDIRKLFGTFNSSKQHPDMLLLVVEDGVSTEEVWQQIEKLNKITENPTDEFIVVLPLSRKHEETYPFNFCTMEKLFSKLRELAEDRHLMQTDKRHADQPQSYLPASQMQKETGGRYSKEHFTDPKKSLKRNHSTVNKVNLVLLGMSGTGKSASGNTILGRNCFVSRASSNLVTTQCQTAETEISGTRVHVIDTPDIFDDDIKSSIRDQHVARCKQLLQPGPCVYLLVMDGSRFTDGERDILKKLEKAFDSRAREQTVILFTRGENLQRARMTLEGFLHNCQPDLKKIVEQCGRRCVVFENNAPHPQQVAALMQTVNKLL